MKRLITAETADNQSVHSSMIEFLKNIDEATLNKTFRARNHGLLDMYAYICILRRGKFTSNYPNICSIRGFIDIVCDIMGTSQLCNLRN